MKNSNIPDGFDFRFHPFCTNCQNFEATSEQYFANNGVYLTMIQCKHYGTCIKLAEHISKEIRRNKQ